MRKLAVHIVHILQKGQVNYKGIVADRMIYDEIALDTQQVGFDRAPHIAPKARMFVRSLSAKIDVDVSFLTQASIKNKA